MHGKNLFAKLESDRETSSKPYSISWLLESFNRQTIIELSKACTFLALEVGL